jgi:hypothetical protein
MSLIAWAVIETNPPRAVSLFRFVGATLLTSLLVPSDTTIGEAGNGTTEASGAELVPFVILLKTQSLQTNLDLI